MKTAETELKKPKCEKVINSMTSAATQQDMKKANKFDLPELRMETASEGELKKSECTKVINSLGIAARRLQKAGKFALTELCW